MIELTNTLLIGLIAYGHLRLFMDGNPQLAPKKYNEKPYGFAVFTVNGKFINYIDLRQ